MSGEEIRPYIQVVKDAGFVITKVVFDVGCYQFRFVGLGLSGRYANSPTFVVLLQGVCDEVLRDRYAFAYNHAQAHNAVQNGQAASKLPYTATLMEDEVNMMLLVDEQFSDFRAKHDAELVVGSSSMKTYAAEILTALEVSANTEAGLFTKVVLL